MYWQSKCWQNIAPTQWYIGSANLIIERLGVWIQRYIYANEDNSFLTYGSSADNLQTCVFLYNLYEMSTVSLFERTAVQGCKFECPEFELIKNAPLSPCLFICVLSNVNWRGKSGSWLVWGTVCGVKTECTVPQIFKLRPMR